MARLLLIISRLVFGEYGVIADNAEQGGCNDKQNPLGWRAVDVKTGTSLRVPFAWIRRHHIQWMLAAANNDLLATALTLDITVDQLRHWMAESGIPELPSVRKPDK
jgi:hypothetical protein